MAARGTRHPVAVITGGSAGVGRATVRELARDGYDVAVLARGSAGLRGAAEDAERWGSRALTLQLDASDQEAVRAAARRVETELGPVDLWVNTAFAGALAFAWDTPAHEMHRITEVTYYGQVYGTLAALELMRPRNRGVIINVGSAMAFRSIPLQSAYCGAKHAVKGFTESVVTELRHEGSAVRLCQIQLPALNTPQFNWNADRMPDHPRPVPPVFQPEVAARGIAHLARHPRRNKWVGVSTAWTVLGERLAPWFLDRRLGRSGVAAQQTDAELPRWGANLWQPRDERTDRGAHGPFDDTARASDPLLSVTFRGGRLLAGAAAVGGGLAAVALNRSRRRA